LISLGLLAVCALGIRAPWERMPSGLTVLVPLLFEASVLWLRLGQGAPDRGVATVSLIPLVWTVLYHRRWESFVVVASIVFANVVVPPLSKLPTDEMLRGAAFWAMLGVVITLAVHDLRDRTARVLARQQELTRRASAMNSAARELTSLLDVDAVVRRAIDLAVELVSPPQGSLQRAHYDLIEGGQVRVQHKAEFAFDSFALAEHLVNDSKGHAAGDELLRAIGQALVGTLRRGDILARVGGDEFAAFCFDADQASAADIAVRMFQALASVQVAGGQARISVGAACGGPIADARSVYAQADAAMYEAKRAGGMRLVSDVDPRVELAGDVEGLTTAALTPGGR
jgi:diguanylate cyclase (GGDEF)-like protein